MHPAIEIDLTSTEFAQLRDKVRPRLRPRFGLSTYGGQVGRVERGRSEVGAVGPALRVGEMRSDRAALVLMLAVVVGVLAGALVLPGRSLPTWGGTVGCRGGRRDNAAVSQHHRRT
jgi:hypothetical protein